MPKEIKVYVKKPGKPLEAWKIHNTLEAMQQVVGGYIETVTVATDLVIVCNEEGRLIGLPYNCTIAGGCDFVGTIFFVGKFRDEFCSIVGESLPLSSGYLGFKNCLMKYSCPFFSAKPH